MTNSLARCVQAAGSHPAGNLLYRVAYWAPRTKIKRNGKTWIAFSYDQWQADAALSFDVLKRALTKLRKADLIETEIHLLGSKTRLFVRLSARAVELLNAPYSSIFAAPGLVGSAPSAVGQSAQAGVGKSALSNTKERNKGEGLKERKKKDCSALSHAATRQNPKQEDGYGKGSKTDQADQPVPECMEKEKIVKQVKPGETRSVADFVKAQAGQTVLHKPESGKSLEFLWKTLVAQETGLPMVVVTAQHRGMLAHIRKACLPGTVEAVLAHVIANWIEFVKDCENNAGAFKTPAHPSIPFLLKYVGYAVALLPPSTLPLLPKKHPSGEQVHVPGVLPAPSMQLTSQAPKDEDKPATWEEIQAILKGE